MDIHPFIHCIYIFELIIFSFILIEYQDTTVFFDMDIFYMHEYKNEA